MKHLEPSISNPFLITGYTTRYHLLLDLDSTSLSQAEGLAHLLQAEYPKLGDALICMSSEEETIIYLRYSKWGVPKTKRVCNSYHIIFDNVVGFNFCHYIVNILYELNIVNRQTVKIRSFRGDMTLRVSPKPMINKYRGIPKPITYIANKAVEKHNGMIGEYLKYLQYARKCFQGHQELYIS